MGNLKKSNCFKLGFYDNTGYTLMELLVALGIGAMLSLGVASLIVYIFNAQNQRQLEVVLQEKANEIKNVMNMQQAVKNTIASTNNANMACLRNRATCTDASTCAVATQCDAQFQNSSYSPTNDRIIFYRNETSGAPTVYLDGRTSNTNGFTNQGSPCNTFSYNMSAGNDGCPIGYIVSWYLLTTGTSNGNTLVFTAKLVYNPSDSNRFKNLIHATPTTASKYDVSVSTQIESIANLTSRKCYQGGAYVFEGDAKLFYNVASAPLGTFCPAPEARTCREIDNTRTLSLTGTAAFPTCVQNCSGLWSACPYPCGGVSTYTVTVPGNEYGDRSCPASGSTQPCAACVPVNCTGSWSPCSSPCGVPGIETFNVSAPAQFGGTCPALNGDTRGCWPPACSAPVQDCTGTWSACSAACGPGTKTFTIVQPPSGGGAACPSSPAACNETLCSTPCVGSWGAWGACSVTCGGGFQTRTYSVTTPPLAGGAMCPAIDGQVESQACNTTPCDPASVVPSGYNYCGGTRLSSGTTGVEVCSPLGCDFGIQKHFDPSTGIGTVRTQSSCFTTLVVRRQYTWSAVTASWVFDSTISTSGGNPRPCIPSC